MGNRSLRIIIALALAGAGAAVFYVTLSQALWNPTADGSQTGTQASETSVVDASTTVNAASSSNSGSGSRSRPPVPVQSRADWPMRISVPSIGIDATVQYVGITPKGNMGVPTNFTDVAWYRLGTIPGQIGSAVIDGHVDNGLALPGVFKHLSDIQAGDDIFITDRDGRQLHFTVTKIDSYDYANVPTSQIFNDSSGSYVKLITCTGDWVKSDRTYNHRLVVTAALANS